MLELRFENPLCSEMVAILIWYDIPLLDFGVFMNVYFMNIVIFIWYNPRLCMSSATILIYYCNKPLLCYSL